MYIQRHYFLEHLDPRILLSAGALPTDPSINVSHTIATLSQPRARPGATAVGTKVFFSGGWDAQGIASGTVDILDTVTHQLSTRMLQPNSNNLEYHSVTAANKALFFGGQGVFDIYDSATDTWSSGSLPFSDKQFGITVVGPKIFFDGLATSRVAIYDVQTGQWTSTKIPRRNESPTGVSMAGKVFYMRAGISSVVDIYDSNTGR